MKKIFFPLLILTTLLPAACNNGGKKGSEAGINDKAGKDTTVQPNPQEDKELIVVAVTYTNLDAKTAASIKEIVDHYLHLKNGLANDNGREAAIGAKAMGAAIRNLDKSFFTAEQKEVFDEIAESLSEHAEHIAGKGDNIRHQLSHFAMMSEDMYALVKAFGAGRPVYHDHCPMYNENKGGMWLSEKREISNPYFGSEMPKCGTVKELIK